MDPDWTGLEDRTKKLRIRADKEDLNGEESWSTWIRVGQTGLEDRTRKLRIMAYKRIWTERNPGLHGSGLDWARRQD